MTRADRLTLVRQLAEEGLSRREIGKRLKVSKDTVRRDLEQIKAGAAPGDEPLGEPDDPDAPQVSVAAAEDSAPRDEPPGEPVAQEADGRAPQDAPPASPGAPLPRRVADPLAGMDVSQWRALRRDFAVLAQTGQKPEALVHQAVITMAHAYKQALARRDITPGVPFLVRDMTLVPVPARAVRTAPVLPPGDGA